MSDALPIPPRPNLEQYKKLAKDFQQATQSTDPAAISKWAARWGNTEAERLAHHWRNNAKEPCKLSGAQFFVARQHGFASWPKFASHLQALERAHSPVSRFETAADAIVTGHTSTLRKLLTKDLAKARSTREHRSTLLHYVSANGIEDFRQKTPRNIVEIAGLLLDAGADVDAESDAYGGGSTTLALIATSVHPEKAGVQIELMELLLAHRATLDNRIVNACLRNGRGQAAEFLANHGAPLDIEGAAGVGRLDLVKAYWPPSDKQRNDAFAWACQFGRPAVVEFLLEQGVKVDATLRQGQTGLHWAAYGGHAEIVKLLLSRGAKTDVLDETYRGTPLDWAKHGSENPTNQSKSFEEVIALLGPTSRKPSPPPKRKAKP